MRDDTLDVGDAAVAEGAVDVVDVPLFFLEQPGDHRIRICLAESVNGWTFPFPTLLSIALLSYY